MRGVIKELKATNYRMVYTTHLEVLQLFFDRRLVPENNFFGVPADDLYDILSLSDVGHNG